MSPEEIRAMYPGYAGWDDAGMLADFAATGGAGKGGSGNAPGSMPKFEFDQKAAEDAAMEELRPYYEKLLEIYNGDVNLAKKRMERDYERGLRFKREDTETGLADIEANRKERDRKFKIALGDLDQEMNTRGIFTSGIKATETQEAKADENFQQEMLNRQARDLVTSENRYKETEGTKMGDWNVDWGFADSGVAGFSSNPNKYKWEQAQNMTKEAREMARLKREQKFSDWQYGTTPLATATHTNYNDVLNNALQIQGLPPVET